MESDRPELPVPETGQTPPPTAAQGGDHHKDWREVREWLETLLIALAIAFAIRSFVLQVYKVEGESMYPTLHTDERLLVNKLIYHLRAPHPGEVIVLQDPSQPRRELVKRVIAVGGETIAVHQGIVSINGHPLQEPYKNNTDPQPEVAPFKVPAGTLYVMGDNRGRSFDSRMIGPVTLGKVDGKAFFLFWPPGRFFGQRLQFGRQFEQ